MKVVTFKEEKRISGTQKLAFLLLILIFAAMGYIVFQSFSLNSNSGNEFASSASTEELGLNELDNISEISSSNPVSSNVEALLTSSEISISTETSIAVSNTSISSSSITKTEPNYEQFIQVINGQNNYISVPTSIGESNLPGIVIYSHGSGFTVSSNINSTNFMKLLQNYGQIFANDNFIFAASNEHGENWGSSTSLADINNTINWIKTNYPNSGKIYLIGHSMGALPTMYFANKYPSNVVKIALLAPTVNISDWNSQTVSNLKNIDIMIWHGNADRNLPLSSSQALVSRFTYYGKSINLTTLDGVGHNEVNSNFITNISKYFAN